ncbi:tryptophan synthase subunit alpha [Thalassotalea eurytherma]|uniref:Tryptophan synthase alpha chain n=1 Tax=Thalassotalea eurytherma TaxID=1144278 RepID=A0ABQ6GY48_9GAMM|nr:tryptophan synthase subunit alpha [Thalassotalea eurytherma]GLX80861.1 tryptophan synthase alpha chain [Thalassotalea eurytherma]
MNTTITSNAAPTEVGKRYNDCFAKLAIQNHGAFIPFVTIGDPNPQLSFNIIKTLIDAGADALELGIPFSDPSADGLTIQKAGLRALGSNVNTDVCLDILAKIREYAPEIPIGLLLYGNLVFARGIDNFYHDVSQAGVDSVLIADLPIRESKPFIDAATKYNVAPIFIAPPNADDETLSAVATSSLGYTYVLSRAGVTGAEVKATSVADQLVAKLDKLESAPAVIGFGISNPTQVKTALSSGAKGAISGSAVVNIIEKNLDDEPAMLTELASFISEMKAATK